MTANCPACGAPVSFRFSSAVQTVCQYCRSVLVRHDAGLERIAETAELPEDPSPIQMGTSGTFRGKAFEVAGRILYEYELGEWNEWHIVFSDGASGWLSDAQLEYAITFAEVAREPLPQRGSMLPGETISLNGRSYQMSVMTLARYRGIEGELPFAYLAKEEAIWFLDLRTSDARFATVDYSQEPPLLFVGESIEFDALGLKHLREFDGWRR